MATISMQPRIMVRVNKTRPDGDDAKDTGVPPTAFVVSGHLDEVNKHYMEGAACYMAAAELAELVKWRSPTLEAWMRPVRALVDHAQDRRHFGPGAPLTVVDNKNVFKLPTFCDRYLGWNGETDPALSCLVAATGFMAKSVNAARLGCKLLKAINVYALLKHADAVSPLVDLCWSVQQVVTGLDMSAHPRPQDMRAPSLKGGGAQGDAARTSPCPPPSFLALWEGIVRAVRELAGWWHRQLRQGAPQEDAGCTTYVCYVPCVSNLVRSLSAAGRDCAVDCAEVLALVTELLAETSRMLAAAGAMASAFVSKVPVLDSDDLVAQWRACWDMNMLVFCDEDCPSLSELGQSGGRRLRVPASFHTDPSKRHRSHAMTPLLTTANMCQSIGQGRVDTEANDETTSSAKGKRSGQEHTSVVMPVLNGALSKQLGIEVQRCRKALGFSWQEETGAGLSSRDRMASAPHDSGLQMRMRTVRDRYALDYCYMLFSLFNHSTACDRVGTKAGAETYGPARWDVLCSTDTLAGIRSPHTRRRRKRSGPPRSRPLPSESVTLQHEPLRIELKLENVGLIRPVQEEARCRDDVRYAQLSVPGGVAYMAAHTVELSRLISEPTGGLWVHRTVLANPASWGPFGRLG
jgi:hypothetical protein